MAVLHCIPFFFAFDGNAVCCAVAACASMAVSYPDVDTYFTIHFSWCVQHHQPTDRSLWIATLIELNRRRKNNVVFHCSWHFCVFVRTSAHAVLANLWFSCSNACRFYTFVVLLGRRREAYKYWFRQHPKLKTYKISWIQTIKNSFWKCWNVSVFISLVPTVFTLLQWCSVSRKFTTDWRFSCANSFCHSSRTFLGSWARIGWPEDQ